MSIFYSYSKHKNETKNTYDLVCNKLNNLIIDVNNINNLIEKISSYITNSNLFVFDITPDYILDFNINNNKIEDKILPLVKYNIILELGIAQKKIKKSNIILLCNEKITKKIPLLLCEYDILYYNPDNGYDYYLNIVDKINDKFKNLVIGI